MCSNQAINAAISKNHFIQRNSPDGGFLQSEYWRKFQESVGRKTLHFEEEGFWANIVEHELPIVGKYFYIPRGPVSEIPISKSQIPNKSKIQNPKFDKYLLEILELANKNRAGWIRFDPLDKNILELVKNSSKYKVAKAPHDMQPREVFVIDISVSVEDILAKMKPKTRYNIRVAEKKGVKAYTCREKKYIEAFCDLVEITARRDGIVSHPRVYYQNMIAAIPEDILKLYCAEYQGKIIAGNLVSFFGGTATYLHGASGNEQRNVMAPYLLQWQAILDAKEAGCERYDFGGVIMGRKSPHRPASSADRRPAEEAGSKKSGWEGITRFKTGFSPSTEPVGFLGSYDVVLNSGKYYAYRAGQRLTKLIHHAKLVSRF